MFENILVKCSYYRVTKLKLKLVTTENYFTRDVNMIRNGFSFNILETFPSYLILSAVCAKGFCKMRTLLNKFLNVRPE